MLARRSMAISSCSSDYEMMTVRMDWRYCSFLGTIASSQFMYCFMLLFVQCVPVPGLAGSDGLRKIYSVADRSLLYCHVLEGRCRILLPRVRRQMQNPIATCQFVEVQVQEVPFFRRKFRSFDVTHSS